MANDPETPDDDLIERPDGALVGTVNFADYYQLEAQTSDWQWLLSQAVITRKLNETKDAFLNVYNVKYPVFFIRRSKVPPTEMAKIIGYKGNPEDLSKDVIIHLKPIGDQTNWQTPTVPYAGAA